MTSSSDTIRVWALFRHYHPNFSGAAIQGHHVLKQLVSQGFSVTVLAAGDQAARSLRGKEVERDGIAVRYLSVIRRKDWKLLGKVPFLRKLVDYFNSLASNFSLAKRSAWILWREGRNNDIVQLYGSNEFSVLPVWAAQIRGMHPVIHMTLLGSDDPGSIRASRKNIFRNLELAAFRRAEAIIGYSSAQTNSCYCAGFDADKVVQIPAGADLNLFYPPNKRQQANLRQTLGLRPDQRYIVFVGSAQSRKGIDVLIRAFIQVAQRLSDVELLIVGPCDFSDLSRYNPARQQLVDELKEELAPTNFASRVHWVGRVDGVHEYFQAADIFCLPTRREGFGTAIAEAMAVGLPVVAGRLDGVTTDIVRSEAEGLLITGHDPSTYADALLSLLGDPVKARAIGNAARARVKSELSLEAIKGRYARLYRELAGVAHD